MDRRPLVAVAIVGVLLSSRAGAELATLQIPLNLTQLSPAIITVYVTCQWSLNGNPQKKSARVATFGSGKVVTIVRMQIEVGSPQGISHSYGCYLEGETSTRRQMFGDTSDTTYLPEFRLNPKPQLMGGTFIW